MMMHRGQPADRSGQSKKSILNRQRTDISKNYSASEFACLLLLNRWLEPKRVERQEWCDVLNLHKWVLLMYKICTKPFSACQQWSAKWMIIMFPLWMRNTQGRGLKVHGELSIYWILSFKPEHFNSHSQYYIVCPHECFHINSNLLWPLVLTSYVYIC